MKHLNELKIMKKTYFKPEMEIVEMQAQQILAGSQDAPLDGTQANEDALAPGVQEVLELFDE